MSRSQWIHAIAVTVLYAATLAGAVAVRRQAATLRQQVEVLRLEVASGAERVAEVSRLSDELADLRRDGQAWVRRLDAGTNLGVVLEVLEGQLSASGARGANLRSGEWVLDGPIHGTPVSVQCSSDFAGALALLHRLEEPDRVIRVNRLTISREPRPDAGDVNFALDLMTYGGQLEAPAAAW